MASSFSQYELPRAEQRDIYKGIITPQAAAIKGLRDVWDWLCGHDRNQDI